MLNFDSMENKLDIGDQICGWDLMKYRLNVQTIVSVTKTLAKIENGTSFKRYIKTDVTLPNDGEFEYVGEVERKESYGSRRYFVIQK